jgi:hypothetical protein
VESKAPAGDVERALDRQLRVIVRCLLDGYPAGQLQTHYPDVLWLLELARPQHNSDLGARLAGANALALQVGWRLFEPILRSATASTSSPTRGCAKPWAQGWRA